VPSGNTFYVLGEVRRPGAYTLEPSTTAVGALTLAVGFTEEGLQTQVKVTRKLPSGGEEPRILDLSGVTPEQGNFS